jgi:type I restriction enzyme S subunit
LDDKTQQIDNLIQNKEKKIELIKEKRTSLINHVVTKGLNPNVKMKDSGVEWIGEIPSHWKVDKVKFLGKIGSGDTLESKFIEKDEGNYPVYGGNGVMGYYSDFNFDKPILIIGRVGEKCGNVHYSDSKVFVNDNSLVFQPFNEEMNLWYVYHSLVQRDLNQLRNKNTQPLITGTMVKDEFIPNPPIDEQKEIVKYLDEQTKEIDDLIQLEQKKIELLKEYRQSLISEVVTGKVRVCEEDLSEIN